MRIEDFAASGLTAIADLRLSEDGGQPHEAASSAVRGSPVNSRRLLHRSAAFARDYREQDASHLFKAIATILNANHRGRPVLWSGLRPHLIVDPQLQLVLRPQNPPTALLHRRRRNVLKDWIEVSVRLAFTRAKPVV